MDCFGRKNALWTRILQGVPPSPENFAEPASPSGRRLGMLVGEREGGFSTFISDLCIIRSRKRMGVKRLPRQTNSFGSLIDVKECVTTSRAAFSSPGTHATSNHCLRPSLPLSSRPSLPSLP